MWWWLYVVVEAVHGGDGHLCVAMHCALHQHPDLCTLSLRWLSPAPIYGGGVSPSAIGTNTPLAHVVVSPIVTCAGGVWALWLP